MKKAFTKQIFTVLGILLLAFVAISMNACSKDKSNNNANPYGQYGYGPGVGGGHLANAFGVSGDGAITIRMVIAGQNGGQAGATGELLVNGGSMGCAVPPGRYPLQTIRPGIYYNGDFYPPMGQGFTLIAGNGMEIYIEGFVTNQQMPSGERILTAFANLPGCPTNFGAPPIY